MSESETNSDRAAYDALAAYTLSLADPSFVHQHAVDAYAAQRATGQKPITIAFALVGLYLYLEKNYSGREVQRAHMRYARKRKQWPSFQPPAERGAMTVVEVLDARPGPDRDRAIRQWARSVWAAWSAQHAKVAELVEELGGW